jgi:hypothetical protein
VVLRVQQRRSATDCRRASSPWSARARHLVCFTFFYHDRRNSSVFISPHARGAKPCFLPDQTVPATLETLPNLTLTLSLPTEQWRRRGPIGATPLEWFHGGRLGGARLPPASSGLRVPNFERRRAGGGEKNTPPVVSSWAGGVVCVYVYLRLT